MTTIKKIAVLTGGGDCPGLNPAIKAVTNKALEHGIDVIGIKEGWRGIMTSDSEYTISLNSNSVQHIDRLGGTILGTSRTNPFSHLDGVQAVLQCWKNLKIDALIAIGGEDTLGVAARLHKEHQLPIVGIPKTIDRDLSETQYSLGFESALQIITDSVDTLRSTAESHARIFVVEVMGRHAGHLALRGQISSGAVITLIPEYPFEIDRVNQLLKQRWQSGQRYSIVLAAEGALPISGEMITQNREKDAFGHVRLGGIGNWIAEQIDKKLSIEARCVNLSHLQRGGSPVSYDRRIGFYFGTAAVEALLYGKFGKMVSLRHGYVGLANINQAVAKLKIVDVDKYYDKDNYCAKRHILGTIGPMEPEF